MNEELARTVRELARMGHQDLISFLRELVGDRQTLPSDEDLAKVPLDKLREATLRIVLDRNTAFFADPYTVVG